MIRKILLPVIFILFYSSSLQSQTLTDPVHKNILQLIRNNKLEKAKEKIDSIQNHIKGAEKRSVKQAELYKLMSVYHSNNSLMDSAIHYQKKAWKVFREIDYDKYFFNYIRTLAYYHWEAGDYSNSLTYCHHILRDIEKVDSSKHNSLYNILGLNYLDLGNYNLSEKYFMQAAKLSKKYKSRHYLGIVYANMGKLYFVQEKYDKALNYFQKGSKIELNYEDYAAVSRSYADIGSIYVQLNQYENAEENLNKGKSYAQKSSDEIGLCRNYLAFGTLYYEKQDFNKAKYYYSQAVILAKKKNTRKELMNGYQGLYKTYDQLDNHQKAKEFLHSYFMIYKDLYNVRKIIKSENLQHKLNLQKEKTANQQAQLEKQETINKLLYLIVILSFLTVVALLLLLIRSRKNRISLKRKNEEIEKQKKDLEYYNRELKKAKNRAERSEALKDHFLKSISHEIRTPLNGIIGFSSIIAQTDLSDSEKIKYQRIIDQNAKMLLSTIEDIIDIAKIRTQQIEIFREKFDVNILIEELQKLISFERDYLNKKEIDILIEQKTKGKQIIREDESKVRKVLVLLGNNALKFTDRGYIKLGFYVKDNHIIFFIEDTGIGISEENQQTIFESFRKINSDTKRNPEGIGLGLTIAKSFVEIMGGKIWFDSIVNEGTTFYFSLPLGK